MEILLSEITSKFTLASEKNCEFCGELISDFNLYKLHLISKHAASQKIERIGIGLFLLKA